MREIVSREKVDSLIANRFGIEIVNKLNEVENAMGIMLTPQQRYYIAHGQWRATGKTTAYIIRLLTMDIDSPLDFMRIEVVRKYMDEAYAGYERFFRSETKEIYNTLKNKGIEVRKVYF